MLKNLSKKSVLLSSIFSLSTLITPQISVAESIGLSLKTSSLGIGLEVSAGLSEKVNVRLGANYFKFSKSLNQDGIDYDFDLKLNSYTALLDWHMFDSGFRLSGGAVLDKNRLDGNAKPGSSYSIGNDTFSAAEVGLLSGHINFRDISPYLGIGWGNVVQGDSNWTFTADLGVIFTGIPVVDLNSTGGSLSNNPDLLAEIVREEQNVSDDIGFFKYYPVVSVGMSYRF